MNTEELNLQGVSFVKKNFKSLRFKYVHCRADLDMQNEIECASEEFTKDFWEYYKDYSYAFMYLEFGLSQIDMKNQT